MTDLERGYIASEMAVWADILRREQTLWARFKAFFRKSLFKS